MNRLSLALVAGLALLGTALPAQAQNYGADVAVDDGAVFVAEPDNTIRSGAVYAYLPDDGSDRWVEAARITAPDAEPNDGFGAAVAANAGTLLASRPAADEERGAVYVFERSGDEWRSAGRLVAADGEPGDRLGTAIAVHEGTALVTAGSESHAVVYVFRRGGDGEWTQEARLTPSGAAPGDGFGAALALDGDRALVGAPLQARQRGAAYLFRRDASGDWVEEAELVAQTVSAGDMLGAAVAFKDGRPAVTALRRENDTGAVYLFGRDEASGDWVADTRLYPFVGNPQSRFGSALASADGELWVGTPGARRGVGAIHRLGGDADRGAWDGVRTLRHPDFESGDAFGARLAVDGGVAVGAAPGDDYGAGTAAIFTRGDDGEWTARNKIWSEPESFAAVTDGKVDCSEGSAAGFGCSGVDLVSFLPVHEIGGERGIRMNDVWGWTDPETGREYALAGLMNATAFIDISEPENPVFLGELPMTEGARANSWRDIKVYDDHAFVVADGAGEHGVQVFDLTQLRDVGAAEAPVTFEETALYDGIHSAHNIVMNEQAGFAYVVGASGGGDTCGGGLHILDVREPDDPRFAGCFADPQTGRASTGYTHDAQCTTYHGPDEDYAGREICLGANETALSIADVTDPDNTVAIARASYPSVGYSHQGWLTDDHRYFYMNDELDELQGLVQGTRTLIWDVADLDDPQLVGTFTGTTESTDHNMYIKGDRMYQSNYVSGLRVIDIEERTAPTEEAYFDTVPYGENTPGFGGSWSNYPFFESGVVIVTSGDEGLFVVQVQEPVT